MLECVQRSDSPSLYQAKYLIPRLGLTPHTPEMGAIHRKWRIYMEIMKRLLTWVNRIRPCNYEESNKVRILPLDFKLIEASELDIDLVLD